MLKVGTRASKLATTQSAWVAKQLVSDSQFQLVNISTKGDQDRTSLLTQIGGTGVFVSAVREALLAGEVDLIVHSLKDLPTAAAKGINLAAIPRREDPSDVLIFAPGLREENQLNDLSKLKAGARVGTGSPRRASQLQLLRPDIEVVPIRGNIDTRLNLAKTGQLDAVILAKAGLERLGIGQELTFKFDPWQYLPAPAQGALAVEVRSALDPESELAKALAKLDHLPTRCAVLAERAVLRELEAGCSAPVGAIAKLSMSEDAYLLEVKAGVYGNGRQIVKELSAAIKPEELNTASELNDPLNPAYQLGAKLAKEILAAGAKDLMAN